MRGRSGIRPTRELEQAMAHLSAGFRELDTVCQILDFQRVHEIQIRADADWADLWLIPRIDEYRKANPNTMFCVNGIGDAPVRSGEPDCEIRFRANRSQSTDDLLFHDYLVPVSSRANTARISAEPASERLEGFPLLHLDCYTDDGGGIGWKEWILEFGYRRTAPDRGIRYRKVTQALEAVYADAGLVVCGLGLVKPLIDDHRLSLPFPIEQGRWSGSAYWASFRSDALRRNAILRFRDWLLAEASKTSRELEALIGAARPPNGQATS